MSFVLTVIAAVAAPTSDDTTTAMAELYDEVCLRTFPDDAAVAALLAERGAKELAPDVVKITMVDDPARAWELADGSATVWLELPPYHACSVRWSTPEIGNLERYRQIADRYQRGIGGFEPLSPYETDRGDIHIHAVGEGRSLADGGSENLFFFRQSINNEARRAAGETGFTLRFVHQFAPPSSR